MQIIYRSVFGSRLYGTELPESDHDYKSIFLPTAEQILLGQVPRAATLADEDESYSLAHYLKLLAEGQTVALDMFFAPTTAWKQMDPLWYDITGAKSQLISRKCQASIGYARKQAETYSCKGGRLLALREVVAWLHNCNPVAYLQDAVLERGADLFNNLPAAANEYVEITGEHLRVSGIACGLRAKVQYAIGLFNPHVLKYGARAEAAEAGGADFKALYHAVRVAEQTLELLQTGEITFPRPNAADLVKIRTGGYHPQAVFERIEAGIAAIDAAQPLSELPVEADASWIRQYLLEQHREVVNHSDHIVAVVNNEVRN